MRSTLRPALSLLVGFSLLTGIAYPGLVTVLAQLGFPYQAHGSLIVRGGQTVGSERIGQSFAQPGYFWSRPSATTPMPYNAAASGGSNLGPLNPALVEAVRARIDQLKHSGVPPTGPVPMDLVTSSASGLDPDISPQAAYYQAPRVAQARGLPLATVEAAIRDELRPPQFGFLGEPRVNVLRLNLALDARTPRS